MSTGAMSPDASSGARLTSLAPQFLVDDLGAAVAYYRDRLGFTFGEPFGGFYTIGTRDGFEPGRARAPGSVTSTWTLMRA